MWRGGCVTAGLISAAMALSLALWPAAVLADGARAQPDSKSFLYFAGGDLWRDGGSFHAGMRWSPGGIDSDGFTLKALLAEGTYRYQSGPTLIRGTHALAAVMPGWHFVRGKFAGTIYGGADVQHHHLTPDDPANRARGTRFGLRGGTDIWWEPQPQWMLAGSLSYATIGNGYWIRGATGWRLAESFWLGPEAVFAGDSTYSQRAFGMHLTGLNALSFEWSVAGGYMQSGATRSGAYGRIGMLARR